MSPNRNYNNSANPAFRSPGSSALIRAEFDAIDTGFTGVEAELDLKAPIASPTFTGTPAAPTAPVGTGTTQIATTKFVMDAALTANVPGQTGNDGKYLKTDGSTASWELALASQTGNAQKFLTTNGTTDSWAYSGAISSYAARTSNTILAVADDRKFIDVTSGTFSQTITAATTLGAGWTCIVRNAGTGVVTLDPDGTGTIDGGATLALASEECRIIICNGTDFYTILLTNAVATQTQMEAAAATALVTAGNANWHPGVAKAWCKCNGASGGLIVGHNITSVTNDATGKITVTLATDFSGADYVVAGQVCANTASVATIAAMTVWDLAAGSFKAGAMSVAGSATNVGYYFFACFGDQS